MICILMIAFAFFGSNLLTQVLTQHPKLVHEDKTLFHLTGGILLGSVIFSTLVYIVLIYLPLRLKRERIKKQKTQIIQMEKTENVILERYSKGSEHIQVPFSVDKLVEKSLFDISAQQFLPGSLLVGKQPKSPVSGSLST